MRKLAVSASKKQRRRLTESRFEQKFEVALRELNVKSHHACPDWEPGVPDRYVCGGTWIEFKSLGYDRSVMPWNAISPQQRAHLQSFTDAGDKCWVCILLCHEDDGDDDRVVLLPWLVFKEKYERVSLKREDVVAIFPIVNRRDPESMRNLISNHFVKFRLGIY
jgi:hypothetical protein